MWFSARVWVDARVVLGIVGIRILVIDFGSLGSGNFTRRHGGAVIIRATAKKASV